MNNNLPSPEDTANAFLIEYQFHTIEDKGVYKVWGGGLNEEVIDKGINTIWKGSPLKEFVHIHLEKFLNEKGLKYTHEEFEEIKLLIITKSIPPRLYQ